MESGGFGSLRTTTIVNFATSAEIAPIAASSGARITPAAANGHGNLEKCVPVLVFHDDPLDVAFVDQLGNLIHQVAA